MSKRINKCWCRFLDMLYCCRCRLATISVNQRADDSGRGLPRWVKVWEVKLFGTMTDFIIRTILIH